MTRISTSAEAVTHTLAGGGCDFGISRGNACFVGLVMVLLPAEASAALVGGSNEWHQLRQCWVVAASME